MRESGGVFEEEVGEVYEGGDWQDGDVRNVGARQEGGLELSESEGWVDGGVGSVS